MNEADSLLGRGYSTARVSKQLTYETAACLRARYCTKFYPTAIRLSEVRK